MSLNSSMNIQVRIAARNAMAQLAKVEAELKAVQTTSAMAGKSGGKAGESLATGMIAAGSRVQWAGRQLTYNFSIPIALAAGAATKFALNVEQGMTRVTKVYGDNSKVMNRLAKTEVPALQKAFRALSDEFGVNQAEVDNVAADWAAAGATGLALAKSTNLTMQTMVLGEMDATQATQALIAIQAQYGMTVDKNKKGTDNLTDTIATLNMVENQTGTDMNDLIVAIARSAGSARSAGVDVRHLAAMVAALVPASGTAASAGNALKTIFSRLLSPTTAATAAMQAMGIKTKSAAWESANGTKRIQELAVGFTKLSGAQKIQAATAIVGRYQLNRFDILLRDVANSNGYYQKSLNATASAQGNAAQAQKELNTVLKSQPQQFKQIGVMLENMGAQVIGPLIPLFIALANTLKSLVMGFTNLDPRIQKLIVTGLALLALFGPLLRYIGATMTLLGFLIKIVEGVSIALIDMGKVVVAPFMMLGKAAVAGAGAAIEGLDSLLVFMLRPFVGGIEGGFASLGKVILSGLGAVAEMALVPVKAMAVSVVRTIASMVLLGSIEMKEMLDVITAPLIAAGKEAVVVVYEMAAKISAGLAFMSARAAVALEPLGLMIIAPFAKAFEFLIGMSGNWLAMLGNSVARGLTAVQLVFSKFAEGVTTFVSAFFSGIGKLWTEGMSILEIITSTIGRAITAVWEGVLIAYTTITETFSTVFAKVWSVLSTALVAITETTGEALRTAWVATLAFMETAIATVGPAVLTAWSAFGTAMTAVWEATQTVMRVAWTSTMAFFSDARLLGPVLDGLAAIGEAMVAALLSPWTYIIGAVVVLVIVFRKKLMAIWDAIVHDISGAFSGVSHYFDGIINGILDAFNALPQGVQNAIIAVVKIVAAAAKQVYQWFSYLNPFAHHSPSLVENVTAGMNVVRNQHVQTNKSAIDHSKKVATAHRAMTDSMVSSNSTAQTSSRQITTATNFANSTSSSNSLINTDGPTKGVNGLDSTLKQFMSDVAKFKQSAGSLIPSKWASEIHDIKKGLPSLLPDFMNLIGDYRKLHQEAEKQKSDVDAQQKVVNTWKQKLDSANKSLNQQQHLLDQESNQLTSLKNQYGKAQSSMSNYASAPIKGMQKFSNEIYRNSEAQKSIQLQMDKWQQKNGSIDDLQNKFAALNGSVIALQGSASNLRSQGAGSDVLGPINDQITAMQQAAKATQITIASSPITKLQAQMDKLTLAGQILQEQNDIKFDPLERQIDKLTNTTKQLTYKQIIAGITTAKAKMKELDPEITKQTQAVNSQKKAVREATKTRNAAQKQYNMEKRSLDSLTKTYDRITAAMTRMKNAMDAIDSSASAKISNSKSTSSKSTSSKNGGPLGSGKGNFANVGGNSKIGREGGFGNQAAAIAKFIQQKEQKTGNLLGGLDMFGPFKQMWNSFSSWVKKNVGPIWDNLGHVIGIGFQGIGKVMGQFTASTGAKRTGTFFAHLAKMIISAIKGISNIFKLFWPDIKNLANGLFDAGKTIWKDLLPALGNLFKSFKNIWPVLKPIVLIIGGALLLVLKILVSILVHMVIPALIGLIKIVADVLNAFADLINFVADVFEGKWGAAFHAILKLAVDVFKAIWDTIKGFVKPIIGLVEGLVGGIIGFFKWLYDVLVGHSIIPDLMKEILKWFGWVVKPAIAFFRDIWDGMKLIWQMVVKPLLQKIIEGIQTIPAAVQAIISGTKNFFGNLWDGVKFVWSVTGKPLFSGIASVIHGIVDVMKAIGRPLARAFSSALDGLKVIFRGFKSAFSLLWNGLKDTFKAPISFLINTVINKGIIGGWNWVAEKLHLPLTLKTVSIPGFKKGGAVDGPGTTTSDSINAKLSRGEHVWTAREVQAAGGHSAVENMRKGALTYGQRLKNAQRTAGSKGSDVISGYSGGGPIIDPGDGENSFQKLQNEAKSTVATIKSFIHGMNPKPYKWDKAGPDGWDCSGAVSSVYNLLNGTNPYVHTFTTATEGNYMKPGAGAFSAGWFNNGAEGHTVGNFMGLKFEARDTQQGILVGSQAASVTASEFNQLGHMPAADIIAELASGNAPGSTGAAAVLGRIVSGIGKAASYVNPMHWIDLLKQKLEAPIAAMKSKFAGPFGQMITGIPENLIKSVISKAESFAKNLILGSETTGPQAKPTANQALGKARALKYGWGSDQFQYLDSLWRKESGWSNTADTRQTGAGGDNANSKIFAYGISQARPATKLPKIGQPPDLGGNSNALAQINWGLNYIKGTYGSPSNAWQHEESYNWYRKGTQHSKGGWAMVGEAGRELVNLPGGSRVFSNTQTHNMLAKAVREAIIESNAKSYRSNNPRYEGKLKQTTVTYNTHNETNINIDNLELPNIKSGNDAETFLKNLKTLSGGPL